MYKTFILPLFGYLKNKLIWKELEGRVVRNGSPISISLSWKMSNTSLLREMEVQFQAWFSLFCRVYADKLLISSSDR